MWNRHSCLCELLLLCRRRPQRNFVTRPESRQYLDLRVVTLAHPHFAWLEPAASLHVDHPLAALGSDCFARSNECVLFAVEQNVAAGREIRNQPAVRSKDRDHHRKRTEVIVVPPSAHSHGAYAV